MDLACSWWWEMPVDLLPFSNICTLTPLNQQYISSSIFVNLDPYLGQWKKLWSILRVYLDPEIDLYCCRTIAASSKKTYN